MYMQFQCARRGCESSSSSLSFKKPLCYEHWEEWDADELDECYRCHWFVSDQDEGLLYYLINDQTYHGEIDLPFLCEDCFIISFTERGERLPWSGGKRKGIEHSPHLHEPITRRTRFVYILKRSDNSFYVGHY